MDNPLRDRACRVAWPCLGRTAVLRLWAENNLCNVDRPEAVLSCCCVGRGGSCELMIGCVGKATCDELNFDRDEMDDVRWVTRAEAAAALRISEQKANPYLGERQPFQAI